MWENGKAGLVTTLKKGIRSFTERSGEVINNDNVIVNIADTVNYLAKTINTSIRDGVGRDAFVTTFGQLAVSQKDSQITEQFPYGLPGTGVEQEITGSGQILTEDSLLKFTTTEADGTAWAESVQALRYIPGSMAYAFFTVAGFTKGPGIKSYVGLFDEEDGFAVGTQDGDICVMKRRYNGPGNIETVNIKQSDWNIDTLDGNGPSGYTVDFTKGQIYAITYGYLGFAPIVFSIKRDNDNWIPFHIIKYPNTETKTHISQPYLPLRAEVDNTGSGLPIEIGIGSIDVGVFNGGKTDSSSRADGFVLSDLKTVPQILTAAGDMIIALRGKQLLATRKNKVSVLLNTISFSTDGSNKGVTLEIIKNPTETTPGTWTELSSESPVEYSIDAVYDLTSGFKTGIMFSLSKEQYVYEALAEITNTLIRRDEVIVIKGKANEPAGAQISDLGLGLKDLL